MTAPLRTYRIIQKQFAKSAFTGAGARLFPGRWNTAGTPVVYTSGSVALATLEMLVHLNSDADLFEYCLFRVEMPADTIEVVPPKKLPAGWDLDSPPEPAREFGDLWARSLRTVALRVPSAVVPHDFNYLLNPIHPDFAKVKLGRPHKFTFDPRLWKGDD